MIKRQKSASSKGTINQQVQNSKITNGAHHYKHQSKDNFIESHDRRKQYITTAKANGLHRKDKNKKEIIKP
jgi:hypothetical protein